MKKTVTRIVVVVLLAGGTYLAARAWLAPKPVEVRVVEVRRGAVESTLSNSKAGTVKARRRAGLSPEVGGSVVLLPHQEGERVRAGDVLIRLADATARANLVSAEKALDLAGARNAEAGIASERAVRELERNRELASRQFLSADALDALESACALAKAACRTAAAEVEHARALLEAARAEGDKTVLRAPFDGVIAELRAELGEWITPSPPLFQVPAVIDLIDTGSLYVSAPMDEVDCARIQVGQMVKVTLDPFPGASHAARVVRVAPYVLDIEAQNRTVEVEVELEDPSFSAALLPGTSADVEIVLERREGVLRVPTSALQGGSRVLVFTDGKLSERGLELGLSNWDFAEVRSGLADGERVVVTLDRPEVRAGANAVVLGGEPRP